MTAVRLDRSKPFVAAAFDVAAGRMSAREGSEILRRAEERHGLRFELEPVESVLGACAMRPRDLRVPTDRERWQAYRSPEALAALYVPAKPKVAGLSAFLSETQFVVDGLHLTNDFHIVTRIGEVHAWTQRGWGTEVANWANATQFGGRRGWSYVDFYCTPPGLIEGYADWVEGAMAILYSRPEPPYQTQ